MSVHSVLGNAVGQITPGLPAVVAGPDGSGRTVLCLDVVHAHVAAGRSATLISVEPPKLLLRQSASLGMDLEDAVRDGRLALLEPDADVAGSVRRHGVDALLAELEAAGPSAEVLVVDPLSALTAEIFDEAELRAVARRLIDRSADRSCSLVVTLGDAATPQEVVLTRVLKEVCGSFVELGSDGKGGFTLHVSKSRAAGFVRGSIPFEIGSGGVTVATGSRPGSSESTAHPGDRDRMHEDGGPDGHPLQGLE